MQSIGERPSLKTSTAVNAATPRNAIQMILNGNGWNGEDRMNYMPAFGEMLTDQQIADVTAYIRSNYTANAAWTDIERSVSDLRKENPSR